MRLAVLLCLAAAALPGPARPCTAFAMDAPDGGVWVGKSYDWHTGDGMVVLNRRGVAKESALLAGGTPARWVAEHASLTFNQYGREFPNGGMNEAGLVVEVLWLEGSRYPRSDERPTLNELQWIQYHLDTASTVAQMVAASQRVRVAPVYASVHYLACDRGGACATFEYLGGRLDIRHGETLAARALTNHPYPQSVKALRRHRGAKKARPLGRGSLDRFVTAALASERDAAEQSEVFAVLDAVRSGDYTKWNVVYRPDTLEVWFRTRDAPQVKHLSLAELAADCRRPVQTLDLATDSGGESASRLSEYRGQENASLLERTLGKLPTGIPPSVRDRLAAYPDALPCTVATPAP